ncbi:hypothetical protein [Streptomyces sp. NPDC059209]|uniref:hypothetical protein n=1 Tax=Streptomyces sp. NPDC059209 TaxID=3346769 RepID=UPI0036A06843
MSSWTPKGGADGFHGITKELKVDLADAANTDLSDVRKASTALRVFLASLMLPASAEAFTRWEVRTGGKSRCSGRGLCRVVVGLDG